ncbi:MAG: TonB-dependent receptor [Planctomycetes bacterium]|jgi:hemoglobin/transferrin/lactoferrin receptor protein|nr:TonB-dependent receptor [Planctomycetota bacterium]
MRLFDMLHLLPAALSLLCPQELPQEGTQENPLAPDDIVVTASAFAANPLTEPWAISLVPTATLATTARTLSESLRGLPSVSVQKTAQGQSSPYLRGLTGYHNLLLVDGVRLNHSAMRPGPNQYWSTVDSWALDRVEFLRGTSGIRYGADAIGGVVHAVSNLLTPGAADASLQTSGMVRSRMASAEGGWGARLQQMQSGPDWAMQLGFTHKTWGDLHAGGSTGTQINTGYQDDFGDLRFVRRLDDDLNLRLNLQRVRQVDVPRTHKTIDGFSWMGTSVGSELWRLHDQDRDLYSAALDWGHGARERGSLTLSLHRHEERRDRARIKSDDFRNDRQGFSVDDWGLNWREERGLDSGLLLRYGAEIHHERVHSWKSEWRDSTGVWSDNIQGPVAADATYSTIAAYIEPSFDVGALTIEPGLRFTHVGLNANVVDFTPSAYTQTWDALTAGVRATFWGNNDSITWLSATQGFRAPSLYDATSTDETSVADSPDFTLEPEHFLQFEFGRKGGHGKLRYEVVLWHTMIQDMIVRSPEGSGGVDVLKDNGDGFLNGLELSAAFELDETWSLSAVASLMNGEVDQWTADGFELRKPVDRLVPMSFYSSLTHHFDDSDSSFEAWVWAVGRSDELSLRDELDTSRIPQDGTPGFATSGLTWSKVIRAGNTLTVSLENLFDKDYRVHGSGLNGAGRNLIVAWEVRY